MIDKLTFVDALSTTAAKGLKLHQSLILLAALPSLAFGSTAMYYNKSSHGAAHFTVHSAFLLSTAVGVED